MSLAIVVDNSVLGDLTNPSLPENKKADQRAFKQIVELAKQGIFGIGAQISTTMIEEGHAGQEKRHLLREIMGNNLKFSAILQGLRVFP